MHYTEYPYSWVALGVNTYLIYYYKALIYIHVISSMHSTFSAS